MPPLRFSAALLLLLFAGAHGGEKIAFPSGATLEATEEEVARFVDTQKTGSKLFKVGADGVKDSQRLTLTIDVGSFRSKDNLFFRSHPVFMRCVQKAWNEVQNTGRKVTLRQGYKLTSGSTTQDLYSRAGESEGRAIGSSLSSSKPFSVRHWRSARLRQVGDEKILLLPRHGLSPSLSASLWTPGSRPRRDHRDGRRLCLHDRRYVGLEAERHRPRIESGLRLR